MKAENVPKVLAVMATAGLYDDSGKWLYRTGLPGKSGVGGGLIAVSPGKFGIAVISPPLDDAGNSVKAQKAIADISNALGGNPLASKAALAVAVVTAAKEWSDEGRQSRWRRTLGEGRVRPVGSSPGRGPSDVHDAQRGHRLGRR